MSSTWITIKYSPGFTEDLTSWNMTIDISGEVTQYLRLLNHDKPSPGTNVVRSHKIKDSDVDEIDRLITEVGFHGLKPEYRCHCEDLDECTIFVLDKKVCVYGPYMIANHEHYREMRNDVREFLRLWDFIKDFAPKPKEKKRTQKLG
jgi:hypothetical protein